MYEVCATMQIWQGWCEQEVHCGNVQVAETKFLCKIADVSDTESLAHRIDYKLPCTAGASPDIVWQ